MEPSLQHLIHCLEQSLGRKPHTPRDFDAFSEIISNATGETISASTLKRLWGYRKTEGRPFTSTLDILARFLLYRDFSNFLASEASIGGGRNAKQEHFIATPCIISSDLSIGQLLQIRWWPNCHVVIRHEGYSRFTVVEATNTILSADDTFRCQVFINSEPLYLYDLTHNCRTQLLYVLGTIDGITATTDKLSHHETCLNLP